MIFIHLFVFGKYSAIFSSSCQVTNLEFDSHLTALSRDLFTFITVWSYGWSSSLYTQLVRALRLQKPSLWSAKYDHEFNKWSILLFNIHSTVHFKTYQHLKPLNTENRCGPAASSTLPSFNHPIITFLYPGSSTVSSFVHLLTHLRTVCCLLRQHLFTSSTITVSRGSICRHCAHQLLS